MNWILEHRRYHHIYKPRCVIVKENEVDNKSDSDSIP